MQEAAFDKNDVVIDVRDMKKRFKVYTDKGLGLKDRLLFLSRNKYEENWVLNGVSFQVKRGEAIGLVGTNGCGKSTTLKLINRIMYPTTGSLKVKGKVSSLIELGAGFHPDMSGRENIYINASIFGLTRKEINAKLNEIIEFSELGDYIENPVRTYSSGMYMRLAFSVAINVRADVLLVDEILAVGDVNFQNKCFEKLREIKAQGTTIVIVSHDLGQIEKFCDRTVWIEKGLIRMDGPSKQVHEAYLKNMEEKRLAKVIQSGDTEDDSDGKFMGRSVFRRGGKEVAFQSLELWNTKDESVVNIQSGEEIKAVIRYHRNKADMKKVHFYIRIYRVDNLLCYSGHTEENGAEAVAIKEDGTLTVRFLHMDLTAGSYFIDMDVKDEKGHCLDSVHEALNFYIGGSDKEGVINMHTEWDMQ